MMLDAQQPLLALARQALTAAVINAPPPDTQILLGAPNHGAFVTLYAPGHALRGCIGTFTGGTSLAQTVARMAVAAGLEDPRFPLLTRDELPRVRIEVSLLSATRPCQAEDIVVGQHGVMLVRGFLRGVFLPKVAIEQGWSRDELLRQLSRKANLPPDAWAWSGSSLEVFAAEVFAEA
jgi:AmmeMemoRadiSam system protein A